MVNVEIKPQLAETVHEVPESGDWVLEPKYDGARILVHKAEDGVHFYTRTGHDHKGRLPHIEAALGFLPAGTWLDGELIAAKQDDDGKIVCDWGQVQSILGSKGVHPDHTKVSYAVFDLMMLNDTDIRRLPLQNRREALETIFEDEGGSCVTLTPQFDATQEIHDNLVDLGWEGSIVKRRESLYSSGKRGAGWSRIKACVEIEVVIMDYQEGKNSFSGLVGALIFGQYKDGELVERGKCSGFTYDQRMKFSNDRDKYLGKVIGLKHYGVTEGGRFRHPQFVRFRDDKLATDVEWHDE